MVYVWAVCVWIIEININNYLTSYFTDIYKKQILHITMFMRLSFAPCTFLNDWLLYNIEQASLIFTLFLSFLSPQTACKVQIWARTGFCLLHISTRKAINHCSACHNHKADYSFSNYCIKWSIEMNVQNNTASDHMWRFLPPPGKSRSDDIIAVSTHPLHCLAMWSLCGIHTQTLAS